MEDKRKIYLLLILLLLFTGMVYVLLTRTNKTDQESDNSLVSVQKETEQNKTQDQKEEKPKTFTVMNIQGTVNEVTETSIKIQDKEAELSFVITKETPVVTIKGSTPEKAQTSDIKKGDNVSITLNKENSSIVSIQILGEGNEGKVVF